jgi:ABC-type glycerol-3-phosphate transport system substrate-binding protein
MRRMAVAMTLMALVAVGCGGGSNNTSSTTTPASVEPTGSTVSTGGFDPATCSAVSESLSAAAAAIPAAINGSSGDIQQQVDALQAALASAPDDIKADLQTVTDGYAHWLQVWQDANIQPGQIPSAEVISQLTEAAQAVTSTDFNAAVGRISTWIQANCTA